jgi:aryl-alcohol dehydrogenase-like predicted oxidoreductase
VYEGGQIDAAQARFPVEIVQLPWNPLDSRLLDAGHLDRLAADGVEIHARSLFLQGLLLQDPRAIPARFGPLGAAVAELRSWADAKGIAILEAVLAIALRQPAIDCFILGITSRRELDEVIAAATRAAAAPYDTSFSVSTPLDPCYLNPARWSELEAT